MNNNLSASLGKLNTGGSLQLTDMEWIAKQYVLYGQYCFVTY